MTAGPASWVDVTIPVGVEAGPVVDPGVVRRLRRAVADRLAAELVALRQSTGAEVAPADQRMLGRSLVASEVASWVAERARAGAAPSAASEDALSAAVFASLFGLGRLQPYVDDPAIENIDVHGCEPVWLSYADGTRARGAAVADSDAELVEMIAAFAAYAGASTREFSTAKPLLDLRLPDGSRLSAWMAVSTRPGLTIRRHRLADVELADLVSLGTLDAGLVALLTAAVRARKNIVVTGGVNAGKTTLVRALAGAFDPAEKLVVAEKDYELALDALPHRHHQVVSLQARDANAEGAGQVSLADLVTHALRMNPSRIIVGEVRGEELLPMLTAMGSGNDGSLCTLHANSAHAAFNRMAAIGLAGSARLPVEATHLLAADAVDLVVHLALDEAPGQGRRRYVTQVLEVTGVGENNRVACNEIYRPGPDGRAVPATPIGCLDDLVAAGLDPAWTTRSWWDTPPANGHTHPAALGGVR